MQCCCRLSTFQYRARRRWSPSTPTYAAGHLVAVAATTGWALGAPAMVAAVPLANQLSDSGLPFAPGSTTFGHVPELSLPEITARYEVSFHNAFDGPVELVMEPGSIVGDWEVVVNDMVRLTAADFAPTSAHVRGSLGATVAWALQPGANTLVVTVTTDRMDGGLLNPLYLAGPFGVTLSPLGLTPSATEGQFEDYVGNRLPFYAGRIEYQTSFAVGSVPEAEEVVLVFDYAAPFHEASGVGERRPFAPVLWEPRRVVLPVAQLRVGQNTLCRRVCTTLIRSFEGQTFDYKSHVSPAG